MLVLSLFPGLDTFGWAFEHIGFCVVRGPELLMGKDIRDWKGISDKFDGIIGGPPCQEFSYARTGHNSSQGNLIPEFERLVDECQPKWFVMENVPQAPLPQQATFSEIYEAWDFGSNSMRLRRFSSNIKLNLEPYKLPVESKCLNPLPTITATEFKVGKTNSASDMRRAGRKLGRRLTLPEMLWAMGLPTNWEAPAVKLKMQYRIIGNGVPFQMGVAIAKAVKDIYQF